MKYFFSFIIPVFNRPNEVEELLESLVEQDYKESFEVVLVEDGSELSSEKIAKKFQDKLQISYYFKENTGPGDSRNFGMKRAKGDYFIILDSDVILPPSYLSNVHDFLKKKYVHVFGGPDAAHTSFSKIQKAIDFSMTSFFTTGGIRGAETKTYEPRSFNMGVSKEAFTKTGGFGRIHPGEDPDFSIRSRNLGYETAFAPQAVVFHKRRIDFQKFFMQMKKFGMVRVILFQWHPKTVKLTFFFPSVFIIGLISSLFLLLFQFYIFFILYFLYFVLLLVVASIKNKSITVGFLAILASFVQFLAYGTGFLDAFLKVMILKKNPETIYPKLFFKK